MNCRLLVTPERLAAGTLEVTGEDHHYLFRVRRLRAGDALLLSDGAGREAEAAVEAVSPDSARLRVGEPRRAAAAAAAARPRFSALVSLIKGERMDGCITRLTELGVDRVIPVAAARSVVSLTAERAEGRRQRYQRLAAAASQQCRRAELPEIAAVTELAPALAAVAGADLKLLFWEGAHIAPLGVVLARHGHGQPPTEIAFLVGPEGGFEEAELLAADGAGFARVGLGPRILRADTAPVAAMAILGYLLGDLGGERLDVET